MRRLRLFSLFLILSARMPAGNENQATGARSASMGNASVCQEDVWSTQNNQAALAFLRNPESGFSYQTPFFLKELKLAGFALALPSGTGTFGLNVSSFGYSLYQENKYGLSFAKAFGLHFSTGIQLDYLQTQIAEGYGSSNRVAGEIGAVAKILKGFSLGIHLFNPTRTSLSAQSEESIPTTLRMGLAYACSDKVLFCLEEEKDTFHKNIFKTGLEYQPCKELFLRAGLSTNPTTIAFGFGLCLHSFKMDFSSSWHPVLGYTPTIGLSYVFHKKPKNE